MVAVGQVLLAAPALAQPSTPQIVSPSNNATVSGTSVELEATVTGATSVLIAVANGEDQAVGAPLTATQTTSGWVATWNSTTVPDGSYFVLAEASDATGELSFSQAIPFTVDNVGPTILVPSNNATVSGTSVALDASTASVTSGFTSVAFTLQGAQGTSFGPEQIATATPTIFGWVAIWNSLTVANGTYTLQADAIYSGGGTVPGPAITLEVNNPTPTTAVLVPAPNYVPEGGPPPVALVAGEQFVLDASASPGATSVTFELTGDGPTQVIATATPTIFGWVAIWNSMTVPDDGDGGYNLQSVASYPNGVSTTSPAIPTLVINEPTIITPNESASVSGNVVLDSVTPSADRATSVYFLLTPENGTPGSPFQIAATLTIWGWAAFWNTTTLPNGYWYDLKAVATYLGGFSKTSYDYGPTGYLLISGN